MGRKLVNRGGKGTKVPQININDAESVTPVPRMNTRTIMDLVYRRGCSPSKYREVHYNWTVYDKRKNQEANLQGRGDGGKERQNKQ
ncbi:hypothetical protein PNOK_0884300 [Pyrrhoderma noxium]|uniref:Uncharacterized protein n=1 Tax=Pyrrhoderma noxium TaxID=2282107 RepID=A0A286U8U0_9AGAM|nr:hypothetical protein PNOK_0884300 [Pyrrhoderma noxium]